MLASRFIALGVLASLGVLFVGCAAESIFDGLGESSPAAPPTSTNNSSLPPPGDGNGEDRGDDAGATSNNNGGGKRDGGGATKPPPGPDPGTACAKVNETYERECGACGVSRAICLAKDDGTAGYVSPYGSCERQRGECIPGSVINNEACGNCGLRTRTCTNTCTWQASACAGEPADNCAPASVAWLTAGCARGVTKRTCSNACTWSNFTGVCENVAEYALNVALKPGTVSNVILPLRAAKTSKRLYGTCNGQFSSLSATDKHVVEYVRVNNTSSSKSAKVTAWNTTPPGATPIDTVLTAYDAIPFTESQILGCIKGAGDFCDVAKLGCKENKSGSLADANQLTIPPSGSIVIAITTSGALGGAAPVEGPVQLAVRTDLLE